jgi:hypothetical protein
LKIKIQEAIEFSLFFLALGFGSDESFAQQPSAPSVGLNVGQKIPPFLAHGQNGHEVPPESWKGANGTVPLFFRSTGS